MKTEVLLADYHPIFLKATKKLLAPFCRIVGTASDGPSVIALAEKLRPAVILLDVYLPLLNGLDACERLLKSDPETKIIFLTANEDTDTADEAIRRGASGYVVKKCRSAELLSAIQYVLADRVYVSPGIIENPTPPCLSPLARRCVGPLTR